MAKGDGGGGHYDERRRAAKPKPSSVYAGSDEIVKELLVPKPRKKPAVKKAVVVPRAKPERAKVPVPREKPLRITPQDTGFVRPTGPTIRPQNYGFSGPGPSFGGPTPNDTPDLTPQDSNFMRPDLRPQNTGFVTPTPQARARAKAGGGRRLEDMIDAYLARARPGGGYP